MAIWHLGPAAQRLHMLQDSVLARASRLGPGGANGARRFLSRAAPWRRSCPAPGHCGARQTQSRSWSTRRSLWRSGRHREQRLRVRDRDRVCGQSHIETRIDSPDRHDGSEDRAGRPDARRVRALGPVFDPPGGPCNGETHPLVDSETQNRAGCMVGGEVPGESKPCTARLEWPLRVGSPSNQC